MNAAAEPVASPALPEPLRRHAAAGVWCPAVTPLSCDQQIARGAYVRHVQNLLEDGCHGVTVFGTTGEASSFSVEERTALLDAVLDAGIPPHRLMVGNGTCALTDTVRLTAHAAARGVKKMLMLPPFYFKEATDSGLFRSFASVFERVADSDLRVFLYHFPRLSGVPITPGLVELLLAEFPGIVVGVKDSSGDWANTEMLCTRFPSIAVLPGNEKLMLAAMEKGGAGTITAGANVNARGLRAAFDAAVAGSEDAGRLQAAATAVRAATDTAPMVPGLKWLVARRLGEPALAHVRPPLEALEPAAGEALLEKLGEVGWTQD